MSSDSSEIVKPAICCRILLIALQFFANILLPNFEANVFVYPKPLNIGTADTVIDFLLGGFVRWDSQYFLHITVYNYTYENSIAFFPLLPTIIKAMTLVLSPLLKIVNIHSLSLICYVLLNSVLFVYTAKVLYNLIEFISNKTTARKCALLFCVNPASIFFAAPYSESLFAFLTFSAIFQTFQINLNESLIPCFYSAGLIGLSAATRSNGLLNLGYLIYFYVSSMFSTKNTFKYLLILLMLIVIALVPFMLVQFYFYSLFCTNYKVNLPEQVLVYGEENNFVYPGEHYKHNQSWCDYKYFPMSYDYVQNKYWNVGLFKYYEFKQIPNFLLALPVIYIVLTQAYQFIIKNHEYLIHFGIFRAYYYNHCVSKRKAQRVLLNSPDFYIFPCVLHSFALCLFCISYVHIQVTTRIICSACPIFYWFSNRIENNCIKYFYCIYFIVGTIFFSNFLPWT